MKNACRQGQALLLGNDTLSLLDGTTGNLTAAYASSLGRVGAQIALASSSAMTPNAPVLKVT
jgi:hypothetical protein